MKKEQIQGIITEAVNEYMEMEDTYNYVLTRLKTAELEVDDFEEWVEENTHDLVKEIMEALEAKREEEEKNGFSTEIIDGALHTYYKRELISIIEINEDNQALYVFDDMEEDEFSHKIQIRNLNK